MSNPDRKSPRLTAVPAARSNSAVLKVRIYLVLGALLAAAVAGLFAAFAWFTAEPPAIDLRDAQPDAAAAATLAANAYLNGQTVPLPVADDVEPWQASGPLPHEAPYWTGFVKGTVGSGVTLERHRFLFARLVPSQDDPDVQVKQINELFIPLVISKSGTPALGGLPYFRPVAYGNVNGTTLPDTKTPVPAFVNDTLKNWANAWAVGDSTTLKKLAGDGTEGVYYPGLGGCKAASTVPLSTLPVAQNSWVVRTRVSLQCANGFEQSMDMDVTVTGAPPSPTYVVGWGAVGSGARSRDDVRIATK